MNSILRLFTNEPKDFIYSYIPPEEIRQACPDPDPLNFKNTRKYNDELYKYLADTQQDLSSLSWSERLVLSRGNLPNTLLGRVALGSFIFETIVGTPLEVPKPEVEEERKAGLRVVKGLCIGEIVELHDIPGSLSEQKLVRVHVGSKKDENGDEIADIRQIVCGGSNILKKGHKVVVALPGARTEDGKKVRRRHFNIPNEDGEIIRYDTDGFLCSEEEAASFWDDRVKSRDQVLILPDYLGIRPGISIDQTMIGAIRAQDGAMGRPYVEILLGGEHTLPLVPAVLANDSLLAAKILRLLKKGASEQEVFDFYRRYWNQ